MDTQTLHLRLRSFGLKRSWVEAHSLGKHYYLLPKADYYIDCRLLPDFAQLSQNAQPTARRILQAHMPLLVQMLVTIPSRHPNDPWGRPIQVICFCAWGCNRSPQFVAALAEELQIKGGYREQLINAAKCDRMEVEVYST
jgi:hypothetical protein